MELLRDEGLKEADLGTAGPTGLSHLEQVGLLT